MVVVLVGVGQLGQVSWRLQSGLGRVAGQLHVHQPGKERGMGWRDSVRSRVCQLQLQSHYDPWSKDMCLLPWVFPLISLLAGPLPEGMLQVTNVVIWRHHRVFSLLRSQTSVSIHIMGARLTVAYLQLQVVDQLVGDCVWEMYAVQQQVPIIYSPVLKVERRVIVYKFSTKLVACHL